METNKIPWSEIISLIIILVVGGILINEIFFSGDFLEDQPCMESICIKYSIDDLNNCKDVGFENFGFLSYEHYFICDEGKIPYNCMERQIVKSNRSFSNMFERFGVCQ
ncbi:hypothetical protein LCGC14_1445240 [marine sediment metagenome]|uniref:Uncharacterized protein n=1 Tax=marine sediment metagenome TaxID=412755 RepID=A0A0F9K5Q7_9ZZZZ